jgi:hypothetical protein
MLTSDNIGGKLDKTPAPASENFRTKFDKKEEPAPRGDNFRIKPSTIWTRDLSLAVSQLRAAHAQLSLEAVTDQREFADSFISPQIERIEKILRRLA